MACWKRFVAGTVAVPVFFKKSTAQVYVCMTVSSKSDGQLSQKEFLDSEVQPVEELLIGTGLLDRRFHCM